MNLRHGSLFNGIGGFQLAASWMGWENVFSCEIDDFCNKVTKYHFPNCIQHGDIKTTDFTIYRGRIDVLTGGFPCQPFSVAGEQRGTQDDRFIWHEMLRCAIEIKPTIIVCENVTGLIKLALDKVLSDLENEGYTCETFIIPACGVGAWHKRDRLWVVAYADSIRRENEQKENRKPISNKKRHNSTTQQSRRQQQCGISEPSFIYQDYYGGESNKGDWWKVEPAVGRVVDGLPGRVDRLKALGNAIVPQIAYEIFKAIESALCHTP